MILGNRARGEPLLVLALVLSSWVGARAAFHYAAPDDPGAAMSTGEPEHAAQPSVSPAKQPGRAGAPSHLADPADLPLREPMSAAPAPAAVLPLVPAAPLTLSAPLAPPAPVVLPARPAGPGSASAAGPGPSDAAQRIAVAGGHQLLWLAALAQMPLPADIAARLAGAPSAGSGTSPLPRWSADGWLFFRRGGSAVTFPRLSGGGTYGASQAGAVLRYRLAPADPHRPALYLRGAGALNGTREQEVAVGLAARPVSRLPLAAMAELRATRNAQGVSARPAVALVTELPPQGLPLGFTGEVYVQAGYVGGRDASAFVDGLMRAERPVFTLPGANARAGAGAWGAKQRGAARLDVGPVASVTVRLGDTASARIEADWRFRVAGGAHPDSGPALTLSAGF